MIILLFINCCGVNYEEVLTCEYDASKGNEDAIAQQDTYNPLYSIPTEL